MTNSIAEIEDAPCLFIIGSNTTEAHPVIAYRMKRAARKGATIIVADPRKIGMVRHATKWINLKVGTDVALLNGIMHEIIARRWENSDFIDSHTVGYGDFRRLIDQYPPERAAEITGVPAEEIRKTAAILHEAERVALFYTLGITEHTCGVDNVKSCVNLQLLLGNLGKPSSGINPLRGQNNVQGACDMGALPNVYTCYQKVDDHEVRRKFQEAWKVRLSPTPGLTIPKMFSGMLGGTIKALYCMGENLVMSEPHQAHTISCLEKLDFMAMQDLFLNETSKYAHVVFPARCFAEDEGTYTNTERRVQRVRRAVAPPGQAKPDWWILTELGKRMGYDMGFSRSDDIWREITELSPLFGGITYDRLLIQGLQWPCPSCDHPGTQYLHTGGECSCGLAHFTPVEWRPPAEVPDEDYPLVLTTGRRLWHYHTGTQTRRSRGFNTICPEETIEVSPADGRGMGLSEGEKVRVVSRRGEVTLKVHLTERSPEGTVYTSFHFHEACGNVLTNDALDPITDTAEYKACAVKLSKL
jgi:formate dehydrogenase major subunit